MIATVFSSLLAATPASLGAMPRPAEIVGGVPVADGEQPAVVAISVGVRRCSGTRITDDLVITAAHCFETEPSPTAVEVILGEDIHDPDAILPIAEYAVHPCAAAGCAQDGYDVAWVRLAEPHEPPLGGYPRPILVQEELDAMAVEGATVRVVGFGEDISGNDGIKRKVDVEITGLVSYGLEFEAGGEGRDSCDGDSGGPALALGPDGRWRLVGVLSRGRVCGQGGVYVIPLPSLCWVEQTTGQDLVPPSCGGCGCLDLDPDRFGTDGACRVGSTGTPASTWLLLPALVAISRSVRRRRSSRARAPRAADRRAPGH